MLNCQNKIFTKLIALHVFSVELKELKNELRTISESTVFQAMQAQKAILTGL